MPEYYFTMARNQIDYHWPGRRETGGYVKVEADNEQHADSKMFMAFGLKWSFRYDDLNKLHEDDRILLHTLGKDVVEHHADPS